MTSTELIAIIDALRRQSEKDATAHRRNPVLYAHMTGRADAFRRSVDLVLEFTSGGSGLAERMRREVIESNGRNP